MDDANFSSLCRICLQGGASIALFEKSEKGDNILTKLSLCVNEKVEDVEGFPRHICSSCNTMLDTFINFIYKFRDTTKILENGLKFVKKEVTYADDSDHAIAEVEMAIKEMKSESDDKFDVSLANLAEHLPLKKKKIKKECNKKDKKLAKVKRETQLGTATNKIASSILEGNFLWSGEKWCMRIGETTLKRLSTEYKKPRVQQIIMVPQTKQEPADKLCDLCGNVFKTQERLSIHKKKAHFTKPVQCPHCPRVCVSDYYLSRHIKRKHETAKDFICSTCGHGFAYKGELTHHFKMVHTKHLLPKKIFSCKFCDKTYKCSKSVVVHERAVHTGLRPAECSICGSCFYHIDYLKEHMRLHTGETPFKCPICGRGYAQRCNMKSHIRIHRVSELDAVTLSKLKPNYLKLLKV